MASTAAQDEYNELFRDKSRRTHHPSDSPQDRSSPTPSDDENHAHSTPISAPPGRYTVPTQKHTANTGVKGVISDAQAYRAAAKTHRGASAERRDVAGRQPYVDGLREAWHGNEEEDEGFMEQWRRARLEQLQGDGAGRRVGSAGRERRGFGGLVPVDAMGYLDAVDGSGEGTVVVVYIYDDRSEVSEVIEECVAALARKHVGTRFVKLHFREAEMEPAGVPAVLAYRGGDKFAGMVPVLDEIPDDADVNALTLEVLFQKHQIL